ncbi:hypothetical protein TIFTF001_041185 [Ficus carica]|uniref:Uncharacterized protein n=1 Tax=Ficus carica TaxID=3494 RepID=A0AA87Z9X0_FICCA|nr:hypothetical protein TIFTF001_041185 [Ficus carica]
MGLKTSYELEEEACWCCRELSDFLLAILSASGPVCNKGVPEELLVVMVVMVVAVISLDGRLDLHSILGEAEDVCLELFGLNRAHHVLLFLLTGWQHENNGVSHSWAFWESAVIINASAVPGRVRYIAWSCTLYTI